MAFLAILALLAMRLFLPLLPLGRFPAAQWILGMLSRKEKNFFLKKTQNRPFLGQKRIGHFQNRQNRRKIDENRTNIDTNFLSCF